MTDYSVTAEDALEVAVTIARCDFLTAISRYTTGNAHPEWIVTVGEGTWQRHIVIREVYKNGDAMLDILSGDESSKAMIDLNLDRANVAVHCRLRTLVKDGYRGVKFALRPNAQLA